MATRNSILALLARHDPRVQQAFLKSIRAIQADVDLPDLTAAVQANDVDRIAKLLGGGQGDFAPLYRAFDEAYWEAGDETIKAVKQKGRTRGAKVVGRFDGKNPRAEAFLATQSSDLIKGLRETQREAVRDVLVKGMSDGANPRTTAIELAGRKGPNGRRRGGIIGLTRKQGKWVQGTKLELETGSYNDYLKRKLRDKRFDKMVRRARDTGKPLTQKQINNITDMYYDRALKYRAETIARTETLRGLHAAQTEGLKQLVEEGQVKEEQIQRFWDSSGADGRTRDSHLAMEGQVAGLDGTFETPGGFRMRFPGDTSLGAPPEETIQCRCHVRVRVDFFKDKKDGDTPPPAPPPKPPKPKPEPKPKSEPKPKPKPGFKVDPVRKAKTHKEANRIAVDHGICSNAHWRTACDLDDINEVHTAINEVQQRFGLVGGYPPRQLENLGQSNMVWRAATGQAQTDSNSMAWYVMYQNGRHYKAMGFTPKYMKGQKVKDTANVMYRKEAKEKVNKAFKNNPPGSIPDAVQDYVYDPTYRFSWHSAPAGESDAYWTAIHESGHYLHDFFRDQINKAAQGWKAEGWNFLVSKYGSSDREEFVAESFVLYMMGAKQHHRIKPSLLAVFKKLDKAVAS